MATFDERGRRVVETQYQQTHQKVQHYASMLVSHAWRLKAFATQEDAQVIDKLIEHTRELERLVLSLPSVKTKGDDKPLTPSY